MFPLLTEGFKVRKNSLKQRNKSRTFEHFWSGGFFCYLYREETICAKTLLWNKCLEWWTSYLLKTRKQEKGN